MTAPGEQIAYTDAYAYAYSHRDAVADSHASSDADSDAYSNTNANTGCESDTSTYRFANAINTARSTAWKQAQDKGRADPRLARCPAAIILN